MGHHYIDEIIDEIDKRLPGESKRIKFYLKNHNSGDIEAATLFEEKKKKMDFLKKHINSFFQ